ncbi:MAG: membrane integrity-associated transporter subunit PqiC [Nitrospirales bacterium]|nr:membrane integrity-associated transporter subunit PqiC [Nitrospirales bacterium]
MAYSTYSGMKLFAVAGMMVLLAGCAGTPPSRFYTLHSIKDSAPYHESTATDLPVALGPVEIPDYLDRPQIGTRTSQSEIFFSDFDRWAGSLREDIARVLSEDITELLTESSVTVSPMKWGANHQYRISVDIQRFDLLRGGKVVLNAQWSIIGRDRKKTLLTRASAFEEQAEGESYPAKIAAMSRALEKLSREIAGGIRAVTGKEQPD